MKIIQTVPIAALLGFMPCFLWAQDNKYTLTAFEETVVYEALAIVDDLSQHNHHAVDFLIDEYVSASWLTDPFESSASPKQLFLSTYRTAIAAEVCEKLQTHDCYAEFIYVDQEDGTVIYPEDTQDSNWLNLTWVFPTEDGLTSVLFSFEENHGEWLLTRVEIWG